MTGRRGAPRLLPLLLLAACASPLERGERLYREGDPLRALETWRATPEDHADHARVQERIAVVEREYERLVTRYKRRAAYYEERDRMAESLLDYRLALKLQPGDAATLAHVQALARALAARKAELASRYREAFASHDLPRAHELLSELRRLDPLDPALETEERELDLALREELERRLAAGKRGFRSGNYQAARRAFRDVLRLDPDDERAQGYLSYIAAILSEAELSGEQPAAFDPPPEGFASDAQIRAEGFHQNALAAERAGEPFSAIRHDLSALQADPEHAAAREHLAALRLGLADRVEPLIAAGREAFRNEDLQAALDLWRRALLIDPANERAVAYIARAERQLANLEQLRSEPDATEEGG
jgi:tetratricopeptide (TPR) repeat protein